jgi:nitric oxide reductase subunit B
VKRLWAMLAIVLVFGFTVLGWVGSRIYQDVPPIPERIVASDRRIVASEGAVRRGQAVWQSLGGMEVGSIWGHGSYVAPDRTADWLHRECELILDDWARSEQASPQSPPRSERPDSLRFSEKCGVDLGAIYARKNSVTYTNPTLPFGRNATESISAYYVYNTVSYRF